MSPPKMSASCVATASGMPAASDAPNSEWRISAVCITTWVSSVKACSVAANPPPLPSAPAFHHQGLVLAAVERENQSLQFALRPGACRQVLARAELAEQALRGGVALEEADGGRIIDAEALQQSRYGITALHAFFAQETLYAVFRRGQHGQCQVFHHLQLRDVRQPGVIDRAEGGDHAEQRNPHHAGAGPEMPGAMASVVKDLR
jgi:hypothetical protein